MSEKSSYKILCVDDEEWSLDVFRHFLGARYTLYTANSGENALLIMQEHQDIALIMCDYHMPNMNGIEFLKLAKQLSPDSVTTLLTGDDSLDTAIYAINEANIFRYISKPFQLHYLDKIIIAALKQYDLLLENKRLTSELAKNNLLLDKQSRQFAEELETAKHVFSKVHANQQNQFPGLDFLITSKETIGGDFIRTHPGTDGSTFYFMLGDLTGHGLVAALAAVLVTQAFDVLCAEQVNIEDLAAGMHKKMCSLLPIGIFCTSLVVKIDFAQNTLSVWQGGLPAAYFLDTQGRVTSCIPSDNLPLGVIAERNFCGSSKQYKLSEVSSLFVYSDGVNEQVGFDNTAFGAERLQKALSDCPSEHRRVDFVMQALRSHQQNNPQSDDISLAELDFTVIGQGLQLIQQQ